jgi:predicted Zn-dependent protease
VVAAVVTLLAAGYSFVLAPSVMHASTDLSDGRAALQRKDYVTAMALLREAYRAQPHSHKVQLAYAEAAFAGGNDDEAMHVLEHVKLSESDWTELTKVMPAQYQQYFETTK